jgi:hypothetical protein
MTMLAKPFQLATRVDGETLDRIENWRGKMRPVIPPMSEAVRLLIETGLEHAEPTTEETTT